MQIFVKTPTGETVAVDIKPSDTFDMVTTKIEEQSGRPLDQYVLLAVVPNELPDDVSIFEGLHKDCKLEVFLYQIKEFYTLKAFAGHMAASDRELHAENRYAIYDWKRQLQDALNDHLRSIQERARLITSRRSSSMAATAIKEEEENNNMESLGFVPLHTPEDEYENRNDWSIEVPTDLRPWFFKLSCKPEWPIPCILSTELFEVLDLCLQTCQRLFMLHKFALLLSNKYCLLKMSNMNDQLLRKKRALARELLEIITVVYQSVRDHLETIIERDSTLIIRAKSRDKIDEMVTKLVEDLRYVVDYDNNCVHSAVGAVGKVIEEFYEMEVHSDERLSDVSTVLQLNVSPPTRHKQMPLSASNSKDDSFNSSFSSFGFSATERDEKRISLPVEPHKQAKRVDYWRKGVTNARVLLTAAVQMSSTVDPNSLNYSIAFQLNPNLD